MMALSKLSFFEDLQRKRKSVQHFMKSMQCHTNKASSPAGKRGLVPRLPNQLLIGELRVDLHCTG